ncbi:SAM-dependent methyltransferase [Endozoicomonas sp. OPT23]|uniref:class I SAM-dependent methyltransferase n=1 Tax=Endozoicomonas sp. OPT23 TaxID=2072845 RepID=UPI00129A853E|nr:class I SAM-dependent methyltransferase [Endozoicomonas sp. OPT23]MRI34476.1 SAM-dependent methyltransferase [Endozoicomonas sp. OPT23]
MDMTEIFAILLIAAGIYMMISIVFWTLELGISPTPTSNRVKQSLKQLLPEDVDGKVYELGCGSGSLLEMLDNKYRNNQVVGLERSPLPWLIARLRFGNNRDTLISKENFLGRNLTDAGLIVCYLCPSLMMALAKKLKRDLPEGCLIISHTFRLPGWEPVKVLQADDLYKTPIYLYRAGYCKEEFSGQPSQPASDRFQAAQGHN